MQILTLSDFLSLPSPRGDVIVDFDGTEVELTSLQRVYFPQDKITKFEVLRYYARMWSLMEPFLQGRPAILQRYPRGIDGPKFFQHDVPDAPPHVTTQALQTGDGRTVDYAVYSTLPALLYLCNLGTIEHHCFFSTVAHMDQPDWLVLDLDPGQAGWNEVVEVAAIAREVFAERHLTTYLKTSGSRGLHIYLPLAAGHTFAQVAAEAHLIATEIAERAPDIATLERTVGKREKTQVYLDWLVNARGKGLAVPYTVRARPGGTVSMPVPWERLGANLHIGDFTLRNVPDRARKLSAAWSGFFQHRQRL